MSTPPRTQESRREATRSALVAAARRLFVDRGYAATGTPELVAQAAVTRGALYHHFEDKSDLLMAVAVDMACEVAAAVVASTPPGLPPLQALQSGSRAYFAAMAEGGRARVLLVDAPAVLSPANLTMLSEAAGADELRHGLKAFLCPESKVPVDELASLLSAAFDRAARAVAEGEDPARWTTAMDLLLGALASDLANRQGR
jgi:AcrR family transcriptional regulator